MLNSLVCVECFRLGIAVKPPPLSLVSSLVSHPRAEPRTESREPNNPPPPCSPIDNRGRAQLGQLMVVSSKPVNDYGNRAFIHAHYTFVHILSIPYIFLLQRFQCSDETVVKNPTNMHNHFAVSSGHATQSMLKSHSRCHSHVCNDCWRYCGSELSFAYRTVRHHASIKHKLRVPPFLLKCCSLRRVCLVSVFFFFSDEI